MPRRKSFPVQRLGNKRAADDMISGDHENTNAADVQHKATDFRLPLPKKRLTELGDVATSGGNNEIGGDATSGDNNEIGVDATSSDNNEIGVDAASSDNNEIGVDAASSDNNEIGVDAASSDNNEIGVDAASSDNNEIGVDFIAKPRRNLTLATPAAKKAIDELNGEPRATNTIMTPAARKAVEEMPIGKPDSRFARARLLACKAGEDTTFDAFTRATQMLHEVIEWSSSLDCDASEAGRYAAKHFQLAKKLEAVAAEKTKAAARTTEKVISLQQQVVDLRAKGAFAETVRNDHDRALDELDAQYDEDDRIFGCLKFNLRVSSKILERTHKAAANRVRENGAFDAQALRFLQQHLDEKTSSVELLSPDIRALLSPKDVDRAVAAGRAKAEALCWSLEHGLQNIAQDLFGPSDGAAALADTSMPELARHLAEDSVSVVEQVARLEALRLMQEARAAEMKAGYSMVRRLRAEQEDAMSNLSECQADLAAATKEMEAAKEEEAGAVERAEGAWGQYEATRLDVQDIRPKVDEAAAAVELVGFDVLKKKKAWINAFEERERASKDVEKSIRRTSVFPYYLY